MAAETLIVVPTYNESENLRPLVEQVLALPPAPDVLVVDDGSPDGTGDLAEDLRRETGGRVLVHHRARKLGLGTAYVEGFELGLGRDYRYLMQMDADFSHDPAYVAPMIDLLRKADLVIGSRYAEGGGTENWGLARRVISRGGSLYARLALSLPVGDVTGGFKAWRRETLLAVGLDKIRSNGYCFQVEMTYRAFRNGARIRELQIVFADRRVGQSKMSKAIILEAVWRVPLLRFGV